MNTVYIALIGDIKESRCLENRFEIQMKMKRILEKINKDYEKDISSKFLITLGDEFQGLLNNGNNLLKIIQDIQIMLHPVKLRFGIGVGEISTVINPEMALGADGPGYYNARKAIEDLKYNEKRKKAVLADVRIEMNSNTSVQSMLINTIFELMKAIEIEWSERQREIIWDMIKHQDGQKNSAMRLGITQSAVQKALASARYYTYVKAIDNLEKVLGEITND